MNETLKRLGLELRRRYREVLRRPMNWRMIDAMVRLEEIDEQKSRIEGDGQRRPPPTGAVSDQADGKVIDLQARSRERE